MKAVRMHSDGGLEVLVYSEARHTSWQNSFASCQLIKFGTEYARVYLP